MAFAVMRDGAKVYYEEFGSGENYVFTARKHIDHYASISEQLAEIGYHVFDMCIRGFGQSDRVENGVYEDLSEVWAEDVCDLARQKGVEKFTYFGMSHGGGIGWKVLYLHPEMLKAFFPIVSGPRYAAPKKKEETGGTPRPGSREASIACAYDEELWRAKSQKSYDDGVAEIPPYLSDEWKERIRKCCEDRLAGNLAEDMSERTLEFTRADRFGSEEAYDAWLRTIDIPMIVFGGMKDVLNPDPSVYVKKTPLIKGCGVMLFQDGSHFISRTHTLQIVHAIDECLRVHGLR